MIIYLVGNPLVKSDSLPLLLKSRLEKEFPGMVFQEIDPNENFVPEKGDIIIDTVEGIDEVTVFDDISIFSGHKLISPHDYDLYVHLKLLEKVGKLNNIYIIGIPAGKYEKSSSSEIIEKITSLLTEFING